MVAAIVACTGACRVDASVAVDVGRDATGTVRVTARLDADAVRELVAPADGPDGDPATRLRFDDLRDAGWSVRGPVLQPDGGAEVEARHPFADPAEAGRLLSQVAGSGVITPARLRQKRGFFRTTTEFDATVDLRAGVGALADDELRTALGAGPGAPLGVDAAALAARFGAPVEQLLGLQVAVDLPGRVRSNAPTEATDAAVWPAPLGSRTAVQATSTSLNVVNILALGTAVLALLAIAALVVARRRVVVALPVVE